MTSRSNTSAVTALASDVLQDWVTEHKDLVVIDVRSAAEFESFDGTAGAAPARSSCRHLLRYTP